MKFLIYFGILFATILYGGVPNLIPVQGVLSDAEGKAIEGNVALTVTLFDAESDGNEIWTESRTDFPVSNGYISLYLGEKTVLEPAVTASAEQLWLEIVFNGERMPRVRLGSVPYALEAIKAQQIGNLTAARLEKMAITSCSSGFYFQGWHENGEPICVEDQIGTTGGGSSYVAGTGILIEDDKISLETPYSAGEGIKLNNGVIKIDKTVVSQLSHDHDDRYYSRIANAGADQLVKLTARNQNGATVYDLKETGLTEANGELTATSIKSNGNMTATIGDITAKAGKITAETSITAKTGNITASAGNITAPAGEISGKTIKIGAAKMTQFKYFTTAISGNNQQTRETFHVYINRDGSLSELNTPGTNTLTASEGVCFLAEVNTGRHDHHTDYAGCIVKLENDETGFDGSAYDNEHADDEKWVIENINYSARQNCRARCIVWDPK